MKKSRNARFAEQTPQALPNLQTIILIATGSAIAMAKKGRSRAGFAFALVAA